MARVLAVERSEAWCAQMLASLGYATVGAWELLQWVSSCALRLAALRLRCIQCRISSIVDKHSWSLTILSLWLPLELFRLFSTT